MALEKESENSVLEVVRDLTAHPHYFSYFKGQFLFMYKKILLPLI